MSFCTIQRFGRKTLLVWGQFFMALSCLPLAFVYLLNKICSHSFRSACISWYSSCRKAQWPGSMCLKWPQTSHLDSVSHLSSFSCYHWSWLLRPWWSYWTSTEVSGSFPQSACLASSSLYAFSRKPGDWRTSKKRHSSHRRGFTLKRIENEYDP